MGRRIRALRRLSRWRHGQRCRTLGTSTVPYLLLRCKCVALQAKVRATADNLWRSGINVPPGKPPISQLLLSPVELTASLGGFAIARARAPSRKSRRTYGANEGRGMAGLHRTPNLLCSTRATQTVLRSRTRKINRAVTRVTSTT